jgi:phosphoribosylaminoimidazole carboxylase (NCAIR synthetase)
MINLVGEGRARDTRVDRDRTRSSIFTRAFPHLYGKAETRTGRKMGHVTVWPKDASLALDAMASLW